MKTYDELTDDILEKTKAEKKRRANVRRRITAGALAVALVLGGVFVARVVTRAPEAPSVRSVKSAESTGKSGSVGYSLSTKADYGAIFENLLASDNSIARYSNDMNSGVVADADAAIPIEKSSEERDVVGEANAEDASEHSETNVQVEGIDEADVVKTDGRYIYAISHRNVYIYEANDGEMTLVSKAAFLGDGRDILSARADGEPLKKTSGTPALYFTADRLIVVIDAYKEAVFEETDDGEDTDGELVKGFIPYDKEIEYYNPTHNYFCALVYDISDRSAPSLITATAISGYGVSSRMTGDTVYLVASDRYYAVKKDDPATFIPSVYADGAIHLVGSDTVWCGEEKSECSYLNAIELDAGSGKAKSSLSLLGYNGEIMYQSANAIYVARTVSGDKWDREDAESDDVMIERFSSEPSTTLTKLTLDGGLALAATTTVEGTLLNSFSMDEYDGYLRVVTSVAKYQNETRWHKTHVTAPIAPDLTEESDSGAEIARARAYDDPDGYEDPDEVVYDEWDYMDDVISSNDTWERYNDLFVLDSSLAVVGSITHIAPDERIYSCRFEGDQGYFVTYRETDPLFHVDLSDPTAPKIVGELKVPGYSGYLQRFGENILGFGMSDDGYLKVSMYSENDDGSMDEITTLQVPSALYSEALWDHHAILADASRGIICFGASVYYDDEYEMTVDGDTVTYSYYSGVKYFILTYGENGFELKGAFEIGEAWPENVRGFYIGDYFYVYQEGREKSAITSLDFASFSVTDEETMDQRSDYENGWDYGDWVIYD